MAATSAAVATARTNTQIWGMLTKAAIALAVAVLSWSVASIVQLQTDVAVIQGNRFTAADAREMERRLDESIAKLSMTLAGVPSEIPPAWFRAEVIELKADLRALSEQVHDLQTSIATLKE